MNPYTVLGVRRNASKKTIQKAFRERAFATHPDRGGSPEEFQRVQQAWKILADPERRRRFDETGEAREEQPDNHRANLAGFLSVLFGEAMEHLVKKKQRLIHTDLVTLLLSLALKHKEKVTQSRQTLAIIKVSLRDAVGRFQEGEGNSLLSQIVEQHLQEVQQHLEKAEEAGKRIEEAIEYLRHCRFEREGQADKILNSLSDCAGFWGLSVDMS